MIMNIVYSGSILVKKNRTVIMTDPICQRLVQYHGNVIHRMKLATLGNRGSCGSLISFMQINPTTFVSISGFPEEAGYSRYVVHFDHVDQLKPHQLLCLEVNTIPFEG